MPAEKGTILVVDDDPDIMRIVLHTLNAEGYRAIPAYGGEDALRKLDRYDFDMVLTDLAMPGMSGVQLIDELRMVPRGADLPIIAMTAFTWDSIGRTAGEVGCDGYLTKPFRRPQLLETVAKYLARPEAQE